MVHMGGESWCTTKYLQAPFPDLMTGYVDHLFVRMYLFFYDVKVCFLFVNFIYLYIFLN